ncbi:MAG: UDP-N-acetylmuramoyl-L-alanine--D-glutamate ligase [Syntrophomonadaceae bacterium]
MEFKGRKVLVIGIARSGISAAKVLHQRGTIVDACDQKVVSQLGTKYHDIRPFCRQVHTGGYPRVAGNYDLVVVSPGVPLEIRPVIEAEQVGIPVIGEVELAYLIKPSKVTFLAITGTNGKTTTTSLLQFILANDGKKSISAGNIGVPLTSLMNELEQGYISIEMSSFQLATTQTFKPKISGLLNITPDHLDRHHTMEAYVQAKAKILANQTSSDFTVLNYDDPTVCRLAAGCRSQVVYFSQEKILEKGTFIKNGKIIYADNGQTIEICAVDRVLLRGKHNLENVLCAVTMAILADTGIDTIASSLMAFPGVRHRMEEVLTYKGVLYVNDSKATNPESAVKALESFTRPIILIAGGRNKGSSFAGFAQVVRERVKALVLVGEAKAEIKSAVIDAGFANIYEVEDFAAAIITAHKLAGYGDIVLLSPACASWDMFESYEHRGDSFCHIIRDITARG